MERVRCGDVHIAVQGFRKLQSETRKIEKRSSLLELDEEIYIARRSLLPPGNGPKHARPHNTTAAEHSFDPSPKLTYLRNHFSNLP